MKSKDVDPRIFDHYNDNCHGRIARREFFSRAGALTVAGASALAMAESLLLGDRASGQQCV